MPSSNALLRPFSKAAEAKLRGLWCEGGDPKREPRRCPYGVPGDLLWVRETFVQHMGVDGLQGYCADGYEATEHWEQKRPAIFMYRRFSRFTLRLNNVRAERLQDISAEDAYAESCRVYQRNRVCAPNENRAVREMYRDNFSRIFNQLHGATAWRDNPWVWVLDFEMLPSDFQVDGVQHPIIFSAPMIRALKAGEKTQTRRLIKPAPNWQHPQAHHLPATMPLPFKDFLPTAPMFSA